MKTVLVGLILVSISCATLPSYSWVLKIYKSKLIQIINKHVPEQDCASDLKSLILNSNSKLWAIEMVDASAKLYPGLLRGNLHLLGNFDQCLSINEIDNERKIKGQYCTVVIWANKKFLGNMGSHLDLEQFGLGADNIHKELLTRVMLNDDLKHTATENIIVPYGLCVPQSCSTSNLKILAQAITKSFKIPIEAAFIDDLCLHKDKTTEIKSLDLFFYFFFGLVFLLVLTSTVYDGYLRYSGQTGNSFIIFSAYMNIKKLVSRSSNDNHLSCLNGLKTLCCLWIVLGHTYLFSGFLSKNTFEIFTKWKYQTSSVFIWAAFYAVDSFFTISGLLTSYVYLKHCKSERSLTNLILFYLQRLIGQTPSIWAVVFLHTSVLKLLADGPYGLISNKLTCNECYNTWWHFFFYFIKSPEYQKCTQHLWYMFVDSGLYLYAHVVLFFIKRHPRPAMVVMFLTFLLGVTYSVVTTINNRLDTIFFNASVNTMNHLYTSKLHRLPCWIMGMFTGYLLHCPPIRISRALNVFLWMLSLYTMSKLIVNKIDFLDSEYNVYRSAAWNGFAQPTWSLALCYIIYSCGTKNGGLINDFLSHHVFRALGKLTYSIYLIHPAVLFIFFSTKKESEYFNNLQIISSFIILLIIIVPCALMLYLGFEAPMRAIKDRKKIYL